MSDASEQQIAPATVYYLDLNGATQTFTFDHAYEVGVSQAGISYTNPNDPDAVQYTFPWHRILMCVCTSGGVNWNQR